MIKNDTNNRCSGFSMIEVLIAIVILSIGLLGIAGMQVAGMKNNHSAYLRSQASLLSYDFADILRSNKSQVLANKFGTSAAGNIDITTGNLGFNAEPDCINEINGCNPVLMAETDLVTWAQNINATLPSGMATVARSSDIYTVTISWLDDKSDTDAAGVDVDGDGGSAGDLAFNNDAGNGVIVVGNETNFKQFSMSFEP